MKTSWIKGLGAFIFTLFCFQQTVSAAGVVTNCDETTLRAAMVGGGLVTFACDGTIALASQLTIDTETTLDATGHSVTLSGGGTTRVLQVQSGGKLTLKRLTISDGYVSMGFGGGLLNSGEATVSDCTFSNNIVVNGPQFGGAINHQGTKLVITGTTFIGNNAEASGGALSCGNPFLGTPAIGNIAITNCTFCANAGNGAAAFGQSISSPVTFANCTFASNNFRAILVFSGGSISPARVRVMNSIIAYTVGGDGVQGIEDWGYNLSTDNSASLTNATSLKNTDPLLGPMTDNGGPTRTLGLLYGSPAIDAASDAAGPGTDQRGVARPTRAHGDIGAFEGSVSPTQSSTVHFTSTNFTAGESQGTALVQVERSGTSAGSVGVGISATAGTATAGTDFAPTNLALVFAEGEMQKSVPVTVFNDPAPEANETVILTLTNAVGTTLDFPGTAQLTILDDDLAYVLTHYDTAGLQAAVNNGGWIQFPSNGTITLTSPITVSQFTVLDASGHNVVLSGGNAVRLFDVNPGALLTLMNLTIANGRHQGPNGAAGADGGIGNAGAINVDNATLNLLDCRIWTNTAAGGAGGDGNPNGNGGPALGGAVYLNGGTLNATNSEFVGNVALGGPGGSNPSLGPTYGTAGGKAWGGAIYSGNARVNLDRCTFTRNGAVGGTAPQGGPNSGWSGEASGGAWFNEGGTAVVSQCSFVLNSSTTPQPIGPTSGAGGTVRGGSICNATGTVSLVESDFVGNHVSGGQAVRALFPAGPGQGGAICNLNVLDVAQCRFQSNSANGGNDGYPAGDGLGGAIFNDGELKILQSEFESNAVQAGQGYHGGVNPIASGNARGGAIFTSDLLRLNESTLSGNAAYGAAGGLASISGPFPGYPAYGGAIYSAGSLYLTNNTLTANVAAGGAQPGSPFPPGPSSAGGDAYGGGLCQTGGTAFLLNDTLDANVARGGTGYPDGNSYGGGLANQAGAVTLLNTIVANSPSGSNGFGTLTDAGHNLSSDASCSFANAGSLNNTDPKLGPLGDYGGPTPTMALLSGSPAIDGGDDAACPATDQRGRDRPYGVACDIGAFESSPPFVIRGRVSGFTLREDVNLSAGSTTTLTTNRGSYSLEGLAANTYVVTPSHSNYLFLPNNRSVTTGPDQLNIDFTAYRWNALSIEGVSNGVLHLAYAGTNGQTYRVLASSNLTDWIPISTNTVSSSNLFDIFDSTGERARFYRSSSP